LPQIPSGGIMDTGFGGEGGAQAPKALFCDKLIALLDA